MADRCTRKDCPRDALEDRKQCEYHTQKGRVRNQLPHVKEIQRQSRLRRIYGITIEQYDAMIAAQGGACAICLEVQEPEPAMHIDHCHRTGRVRGLLCSKCNKGLGHFDDNLELLHAASAYLLAQEDVIGRAA